LITLVYLERLGDVLQMLPAAKWLHDQGRGPVHIACAPKYSGVLDLVTYATWTPEPVGDVIDLQIWPNRYQEYRASGLSWMDFVYADPRIACAERTILLDNLPDRRPVGLPDRYNLLAPHGISQGFAYPLDVSLYMAKEKMGEFVLLHEPADCFYTVPHWSAASIVELALAIRHADQFMCINSSPAILASALRRGRLTYFLPQQGQWTQDNCAPWPGRIDYQRNHWPAVTPAC